MFWGGKKYEKKERGEASPSSTILLNVSRSRLYFCEFNCYNDVRWEEREEKVKAETEKEIGGKGEKREMRCQKRKRQKKKKRKKHVWHF
jgi:hypothetical protein